MIPEERTPTQHNTNEFTHITNEETVRTEEERGGNRGNRLGHGIQQATKRTRTIQSAMGKRCALFAGGRPNWIDTDRPTQHNYTPTRHIATHLTTPTGRRRGARQFVRRRAWLFVYGIIADGRRQDELFELKHDL